MVAFGIGHGGAGHISDIGRCKIRKKGDSTDGPDAGQKKGGETETDTD